MSLFRRTFSRRVPDRLLEISERIYVFDSCLSNTTMSENDFKSYLGGVVMNLQKFHPGASFMVFNFREGDQTSLLSDILIDYDMAVVDYPQHHEGYPMLPLEMIHYFLRSSDSWLSLEGQKNVILMNCGKGGWPVLAFMLAGLLLYRKQYTGEQKTLEMVYKQAPKEIQSVLSPINPRASQLRYLQYITGRDLASEWPPSDAPLIMDYLLLHNLPLFDNAKGCRPVVRVYGQDPSAKGNRNPQLIYSTLMSEEPVWLYSKEECVFVKLELRCQVQGDVFLECIHLYDDLASEEMIFKLMFHTRFIQFNILAVNSDEIDVPSKTKYYLPKDFKTEVIFGDINAAPQHITMELGSGEEGHDSDSPQRMTTKLGSREGHDSDSPQHITTELGSGGEHDSDSEFFEVEDNLTNTISREMNILEENFTLMSGSEERRAGMRSTIAQEANILEENLIPMFESKERKAGFSTLIPQEANILEKIFITTSESQETKIDTLITQEADTVDNKSKDCTLHNGSPRWDLESEINYLSSLKDIALDEGNPKQTSDIQQYIKNIEVTDVSSSQESALEEGHQNQITEAKTKNDKQAPGAEPCMNAVKDILVLDDINHKPASEKETDISASAIEVTDVSSSKERALDGHQNQITEAETENDKQAPGAEPYMNAVKDILVLDDMNHKPASEKGSDISASAIEVTDVSSSKERALDGHQNKITEAETENDKQALGAEPCMNAVKDNLVLDDMNHKLASEKESDISASAIEVTDVSSSKKRALDEEHQNQITEAETENDKQAPGAEPCVNAVKDILVLDDRNHKPASEKESEFSSSTIEAESDMSALKSILVIDDHNHKQVSLEESDISTSARGAETDMSALKKILVSNDRNHNHASENESDISGSVTEGETSTIPSKNIFMVDDRNPKQASDEESVISASAIKAEPSKNIVVRDARSKKQPSEAEIDICASKNIVVVADGSQIQEVKVEIEPKPVPSFTKSKQNKKNKWQEITSKTIKQQRVVSQWVPRTKPPAPEPTKPKPPVYKWVPKGTSTPKDEQ